MIIDDVNQKLYFSSIRTVTLALLGAFDKVKHWVPKETEVEGETKTSVFDVPITFGNYEKSVMLEDIPTETLTKQNYNFLPRIVLGFESIAKNPDRSKSKFNKISKKYEDPNGDLKLNYAYESVPYDFEFNMLIQARGLNQASMLVEQIMWYFRPTMSLEIQEMPLFAERTITQVTGADPTFEIIDAFEDTDFNLINISIPMVVRSNLYGPITISGPVNKLILKDYVYTHNINEAKLAWHYELDANEDHTEWILPATVDEHYS